MIKVFLDVETTGTEEYDKIVQLAFKVGDTYYNQLYNPGIKISIDAMSITHITNEDVADKPAFKYSPEFRMLQELLERDDVVLIAHNAKFDIGFLNREGLPLPKNHICTLKISHHHDKSGSLQKNNLQYLRYNYGLQFDQPINPHDALSDIIVLEKLFDFYNEIYSIEEMIDISKKPILFKKMMFGKYKGMTFISIARADPDYIKWALREMNTDENLKYTLEHALKNI